jgi:hypothetical protein
VESGFPTCAARCIADFDVCCAGPQLNAVLSDTLAKSILDCTVFTSMQTLCKPLAAIQCRSFDEFDRLASEGGIP